MYPDYDRSILSTASAILNFYGIKSPYPPVPELSEALAQGPRNVVLFILDGLGTAILDAHSAESVFLRAHQVSTLTSVYPSTTTAATTAYYTGQSPAEHGWLGWSLYFKEYGRLVDAFLARDSYTGEPLSSNPACELMPLTTIYQRIADATQNRVMTTAAFPFESESMTGANERIIDPSFAGLTQKIQVLTRNPDEKFILCYHSQPDAAMHALGVRAPQVGEIIRDMNLQIENLYHSTRDTLIVVTADHGLVDIDETIYLEQIPEISECLLMPPALEPRAMMFYIRPDMLAEFETRFVRRFSDRFTLFSREQMLSMNLFGRGAMHPKALDFIGDYIACATGNAMLRYRTRDGKEPAQFAAAHAGLRPEEMQVPLILLKN